MFDSFSSCNFSNWDTMVIELSVGGILALVFFYIQNRNTKLINMMLKGQFDYVVKDSINKLLWMENGLENIQNYLQEKNFEKIRKIIDCNSKIIDEIKLTIDKHKDIAPQLFDAINQLKKLNDKILITLVEIKALHSGRLTSIPTNKLEQLQNDLQNISSTIQDANVYNIKKFGPPSYPEYATTFVERSHVQLNIPSIQTIISFATGIAILFWIYPRTFDIIQQLPIIDEQFFLTWLPVIPILLVIVIAVRFILRFFIRF